MRNRLEEKLKVGCWGLMPVVAARARNACEVWLRYWRRRNGRNAARTTPYQTLARQEPPALASRSRASVQSLFTTSTPSSSPFTNYRLARCLTPRYRFCASSPSQSYPKTALSRLFRRRCDQVQPSLHLDAHELRRQHVVTMPYKDEQIVVCDVER